MLWLGWSSVEVETRDRWYAFPRRYNKRAVRLSPLGHAIVQHLGVALRAGKPIRWARHRSALVAAVRRRPHELLSELEAELARQAEATAEVAELVARVRHGERTVPALDGAAALVVARRAVSASLRISPDTG